ncbi:MAG: DUF3596 domain-containing protein [Nostoc sp.]|uniref:Arm DNA-binding domain-containing protein n=1 Tax=Nostoc sp. TaxID=1180 RepID=UPI002FF6C2BB
MTENKWITSDARTEKLVIRFWVKGFPKQFFISTGLKDTKRNREIVRLKRDAIANDITLNRFDPSLISYQSRIPKQQLPIITQYSICELWEKFTEFQDKQLDQQSPKLIRHRKRD